MRGTRKVEVVVMGRVEAERVCVVAKAKARAEVTHPTRLYRQSDHDPAASRAATRLLRCKSCARRRGRPRRRACSPLCAAP